MILNAALDPVEKIQWNSNNMYLKEVDKFNDLQIHCFLTPSNTRFLLLHEARSEDNIKMFFNDVYDLFVKLALNPFYKEDEKIQVESFFSRME